MTTPQNLRAQADAMDAEAAMSNKGRVYIWTRDGSTTIHDGGMNHQRLVEGYGDYSRREATEAEIQALRVIPEFAARLDKVRNG